MDAYCRKVAGQRNTCRKTKGNRNNNEYCDNDNQCKDGLCWGYICRPRLPACTALSCNQSVSGTNQPCHRNQDCVAGAYCRKVAGQRNTCRKTGGNRNNNEYCDNNNQCTSKWCHNWKCREKINEGHRCHGNNTCKSGWCHHNRCARSGAARCAWWNGNKCGSEYGSYWCHHERCISRP